MNYKFGDGWKLHADYGYNDARDQFDELQLYSGFGLNGQPSTSTATSIPAVGCSCSSPRSWPACW